MGAVLPFRRHLPIARDARAREVRAHTEDVRRLPKRSMASEARAATAILSLVGPVDRPRTRGDCAGGSRPCPFVACRHHLYLDVMPTTGSIKLNFPDVPPDELERLPATCSLDVADMGGITLHEVGALLNLTRERVRQIQERAAQRARTRGGHRLADFEGHESEKAESPLAASEEDGR